MLQILSFWKKLTLHMIFQLLHKLRMWSLSGESLSWIVAFGEKFALDKQAVKWNLSSESTSPRSSLSAKASQSEELY